MEVQSIFNKLKDGDINSFEYIINRYEKKVFKFIFNLTHDEYMTQDLTQDVFIKIYKNFYKYDTEYPFEPWMYKIAYNITINYLKKNKNVEYKPHEELDNEYEDEDSLNNIEMRETLTQELFSLPSDCKAIFILRIVEDLSFEQIGELLGITAAAAKLKFYRNRKFLVDKFEKIYKGV